MWDNDKSSSWSIKIRLIIEKFYNHGSDDLLQDVLTKFPD